VSNGRFVPFKESRVAGPPSPEEPLVLPTQPYPTKRNKPHDQHAQEASQRGARATWKKALWPRHHRDVPPTELELARAANARLREISEANKRDKEKTDREELRRLREEVRQLRQHAESRRLRKTSDSPDDDGWLED
jgi:hypothetical protein